MDEITVEALTNMTGVLQSFLPAADPSVDQSLILIPQKVKPTGLGGYVGIHEDPNASLVGRHIQAVTEVTLISSAGVADLQTAVNNVTQELLAQDRETLRNNGIYKLNFNGLSDISHSGQGSSTTDTRSIKFDVDFEFIPIPVVEEGVINEFIHNFDLALSKGDASFFHLNFKSINAGGDNPLDYFDVLDDPGIVGSSPAGSWSYDAVGNFIEQTSNVRGGPATVGGRKAGAHALAIKDNVAYESKNFILKASMASSDLDGIGFVFRRLDDENFYYLLFSARHSYTLIGKKVQGAYSGIAEGGLNDTSGHTEDVQMEVKLIVDGNRFQVYRNNQFITSGFDDDISEAGRLGFLTHRNSAANFYDVYVVEFDE